MNLLKFDKSFHDLDCYLNDDDRKSLDGWLTDNIIQFACEVIEQNMQRMTSNKSILMLHPTACLIARTDPDDVFDNADLPHKEWIFLPIHNAPPSGVGGGDHWSLLVFSNEQKASYYLDSMCSPRINLEKPSNSLQIAMDLNSALNKSLGTSKELVILPCAQQTNSIDCGVYVILFVQWICAQLFESDTTWTKLGLDSPDIEKVALNFRQTLRIEVDNYFESR